MNSDYSPSVLVLGHGPRAFLQVIRSLGRQRIAVDTNQVPSSDLAAHSKYIRETVPLPPPQADAAVWDRELTALLDRKHYDLVIPCTDSFVAALARYRKNIQPQTRICLPSDEALAICNSKWQSAQLAEACGLPVPEGHKLPVNPDLLAFVRHENLPFPLIAKPLSSSPPATTPPDQAVRRTVQRIRSFEQLEKFVKTHQHWGECVIQKNFNGRGMGVYLLVHDGEPLTWISQERLHEPLEGGGGHYRRTIETPPQLIEPVRRFLQHIHYSGVIMFEFRYDRTQDAWTFIETNPRFWGSLALSLSAGADFPYWLYQMWCHNQVTFPNQFRTPMYCRNLTADLYWLKENFHADKSDSTLATQPVGATIGQFARLLWGREAWDSFAWDDPRPFLQEVRSIASDIGAKVTRKVWPRAQDKMLSRSRMRKACSGARRILVVCRGNICRSPYAASILETQLGNAVQIRQGGSFEREHRPSPQKAIQAAAKMGVDLEAHRSRRYGDDDLAWADLILCFDQRNYDELRACLGENTGRLWPLAAAIAQRSPWIDDPYGQDVHVFEATYRQIDICCDVVLPWIQAERSSQIESNRTDR